MRRRDISKMLVGSAAGATLLPVTSQAQAACALPCYPQTEAEKATAPKLEDQVMPKNTAYVELDLRRYYSGMGTYDTAMADAIRVCGTTGGTIVLPRGTLTFSAPINLASKASIILQGQGGVSGGAAPGTKIEYTYSSISTAAAAARFAIVRSRIPIRALPSTPT